MNIEIKAEDVEKMVRDELLKAGLGKVIAEAATKALSGYNNPVDEAVKRYIGEVAGQMIRQHFSEKIEEAVIALIKARVTDDLIQKVTHEAVSKMVAIAERGY